MPSVSRLIATLALLFGSTSWAAQNVVPIDTPVQSGFMAVRSHAAVETALAQIEAQDAQYLDELIRLTEIPAPPFKEAARAAYYLEQMKRRGLQDAYIDDEGNAIGIRKGIGDGPTILVAAHLDTVFPEGVDTTVQERDGRYYAPGIGDDTRGLASLLSVIEALNDSGIQTRGDIIFAGNVGEEGRGDLRGAKALFRDHPDIDGFISVDGVRLTDIINGGTGSRRFEFHFRGPGGHSFGAFGLASAIHAMGRAIAKIGDVEPPRSPKTTFTVGTVEGGTSVNSIAADAVFALDMRSNGKEELAALESEIKALALEAVAEENARWNNGEITVEFRLIGDRPVGMTPANSAIVQATALAFDAVGANLEGLKAASTDSNVPMSLGIPAVTISAGGDGGGAHSPDEWFAPVNAYRGPQTVLLVTLAMVGIADVSAPLLPALD